MSPPQQISRAGEYSYKPRSTTPDKPGSILGGTRQRSASSGTALGPHRPLYETQAQMLPVGPIAYDNPHQPLSFGSDTASKIDREERNRRTSLSGILQRPSSQPQPSVSTNETHNHFVSQTNQQTGHFVQPEPTALDLQRQPLNTHSYDTKPPGLDPARPFSSVQTSPSVPVSSISPELRRTSVNGTSRGLANILNGPTSQPTELNGGSSQGMMRQDSTQSQSDRSLGGERSRFRNFSPYTGSMTGSSGPGEEVSRKGSDEISHRTIIGLGAESRRGRYSPVPQVVQGAQAQTPVPDGGVKSEHGRVFAGLGGSIGTAVIPSVAPVPLPASPFKRDAAMAKLPDEEASKTTGSATHTSKRARKILDDDGEAGESRKGSTSGKAGKRSKYQNSYKADLEEMANFNLQRHGTPLNTHNSVHRTSTPTNTGTGAQSSSRFETTPIFKSKKTIKVASVMSSVLKKTRRHLGTFKYEPEISVPDEASLGLPEFDVVAKPKLLPAFTDPENLNCTYTIRVSKTWLQPTERRIVSASRNFWGSGIYTDDSDPVAAAMHMGWIRGSYNVGVDENLLARVITEQNPKVDVAKEFRPPNTPMEIPKGQDLKIVLVVMPPMDRYPESVRYGIRSRPWPEGTEKTPHDGCSFAILKAEFVDLGPEERKVGRTGEAKRARLRAQLEARARAGRKEKERLEKIKERMIKKQQKRAVQDKVQQSKGGDRPPTDTTSAPAVPVVELPNVAEPTGLTENEEWRRQLATAAA